jgi:HNH endonuclease
VNREICIYCKQPGFSKEHVAPASLGGNCTITCVCVPCNSQLSTVDSAVGDRSPVALSKVGDTPQAAFQTQIDTIATMYIDGEPVAVRVENQMKARILPQVTLRESQMGVRVESIEDLKRLVKHVEKQLKKGKLAETSKRIDDEQAIPRFVLYRSDESTVLCRTDHDGDQILRVMQKDWNNISQQLENSPKEPQAIENPSVLIKMRMDVNGEFRGVAKMAFETLAVLEGPDFVLNQRFDPIRSYILGDVQLPDEAPEDGLLVDQRFVKRMGEDAPKITEDHAVLFVSNGDHLQAFVTLYGRHTYVVELANEGENPFEMRMYEFSTSRDGHREVAGEELGEWMIEFYPEQLGLSKQESSEIIETLRSSREKGVKVTGTQFAKVSKWLSR